MMVGTTIKYMISTQEEQLTQTLYDATRYEISHLRRQARADDG